jgi:hypothetical protein
MNAKSPALLWNAVSVLGSQGRAVFDRSMSVRCLQIVVRANDYENTIYC